MKTWHVCEKAVKKNNDRYCAELSSDHSVDLCLSVSFLNVLSISFSGYDAVLPERLPFIPIDFSMEAYKQILGRSNDLDFHENDSYHHTF